MRSLAISLALLATTLCCRADAADTGGLAKLRARYHCEIVARLVKLKAAKGPSDRFIVIGGVLRQQQFAQCLFNTAGTQMLCEASSVYYSERNTGLRFFAPSAETIAAVARLGFTTDPNVGNFQRKMEARTNDELSKIADLLLATVHDAYGMNVTTRIEIKAPLAPLTRKDRARCLPVS